MPQNGHSGTMCTGGAAAALLSGGGGGTRQLLLCLSSSDVAMLANDLVVWQWLGLSVLTSERKGCNSTWFSTENHKNLYPKVRCGH